MKVLRDWRPRRLRGPRRGGPAHRLDWNGPGGPLASDEVVRSRTGRTVDQRVDGTDAFVGTGFATAGSQNFAYDGAGRLTGAWQAVAKWPATGADRPDLAGLGRNPNILWSPAIGCGILRQPAGPVTARASTTS